MNAKDLVGKKIIDKQARDLAKIAEITFNIKTFKIINLYGSTGNPLSKKYYEIPVNAILAVGDYIQIADTLEELSDKVLDKIPEKEEQTAKVSNLMGKTMLDTEGNVVGKVSNVDIDFEKFEINCLELTCSTSSFGKTITKKIGQTDVSSIGDYIIINKDSVESEEEDENEKEDEEKKETVNVNIE